jgi:hypothetical protein
MAHRHRPFFNLDQPVGRNKNNLTDDVMLVQFFLSETAKKNVIFDWKKPAKPLTVNGSADENLFAWILSFQQGVKSQGTPVHVDGIVDPARGAATTRSSITQSIYTIVLLNNLFESQSPDRFTNLQNDPGVPATLRAALQRGV